MGVLWNCGAVQCATGMSHCLALFSRLDAISAGNCASWDMMLSSIPVTRNRSSYSYSYVQYCAVYLESAEKHENELDNSFF